MTDTAITRQAQPQLGLFSYPYQPGFKALGTSAEAAANIAPRAKSLREATLEAIRQKPGTPDEIAARLGKSILSIRPRVSELIALGLVKESEQRRANRSGHRANVVEASNA